MLSQRTDYKHEGRIKKWLTKLGKNKAFNYFATISFLYRRDERGSWFKMTKQHINDCFSMIKSYAKSLSNKLFGRQRKRSKETHIPLIALPEYIAKDGSETHLHYHIVVAIPPTKRHEFSSHSKKFWKSMSIKHGLKVDPDIRACYDATGALSYSLKWLNPEFTIQNMVTSGPLLELSSVETD